MALYEIRPLQLRILEILRAVDKTCREHDLCYYIWAGTMIGAVRHKGFIPWDDDLDIAMPRPDYERLIAHQREWLPKPFESTSLISLILIWQFTPHQLSHYRTRSQLFIRRCFLACRSAIFWRMIPELEKQL